MHSPVGSCLAMLGVLLTLPTDLFLKFQACGIEPKVRSGHHQLLHADWSLCRGGVAPGQAFSRERLLDRVWGLDFGGDLRTVDSHIKNLREKLGDGASIIATLWGIGYRFVEAPNA